MRLAVYGASGYSGGNIAREAVARGHEVVAVTRGDAPGDDGGLSWTTGSLFDPEQLAELAEQVDVVIIAVQATGGPQPLGEVVGDVVATAAAHGARVGVVGGAGSLQVSEGGPALFHTDALPEAYRAGSLAQGAVLDALREVPEPADWFYLSPAGAYGKRQPGERTGTFRVGGDVLLRDADGTSYVSGEDYAIAFLDEIEEPRHRRGRFTVAY